MSSSGASNTPVPFTLTYRWVTLNTGELYEDLRSLQSEWESGRLRLPMIIKRDWRASRSDSDSGALGASGARVLRTNTNHCSRTGRLGVLGPQTSSKRRFDKEIDLGLGSQHAQGVFQEIIPDWRLDSQTWKAIDERLARTTERGATIYVRCIGPSKQVLAMTDGNITQAPDFAAPPIVASMENTENTLSLCAQGSLLQSGRYVGLIALSTSSSVEFNIGEETFEAEFHDSPVLFGSMFQFQVSAQPKSTPDKASRSEEN